MNFGKNKMEHQLLKEKIISKLINSIYGGIDQYYKSSLSMRSTKSHQRYLKLKYSKHGAIYTKNGTPNFQYNEYVKHKRPKSQTGVK